MPDPENYYGDEPHDDSKTPPHDESSEDSGKQTAVLPAELCPGMKVGDEIKLRIVSADEDSYEVSYEPEEKAPGKGASEPEPEPEEGSMASMMQ